MQFIHNIPNPIANSNPNPISNPRAVQTNAPLD